MNNDERPEFSLTDDQAIEIELTCGIHTGEAWRQRTEEWLGGKIKRVTPAEAEKVDFVVCALRDSLPKYFADDEYGSCADCGVGIRWRPACPKTPPKICMTCVSRRYMEYQLKELLKGPDHGSPKAEP